MKLVISGTFALIARTPESAYQLSISSTGVSYHFL